MPAVQKLDLLYSLSFPGSAWERAVFEALPRVSCGAVFLGIERGGASPAAAFPGGAWEREVGESFGLLLLGMRPPPAIAPARAKGTSRPATSATNKINCRSAARRGRKIHKIHAATAISAAQRNDQSAAHNNIGSRIVSTR